MKKLIQKLLAACFIFSLAGCYGSWKGGEESLMNGVSSTLDYELSNKTKLEIEEGKEKIIVSEYSFIQGYETYREVYARVTTMIESISEKMEENDYTIISSDICDIANSTHIAGYSFMIMLIFSKK